VKQYRWAQIPPRTEYDAPGSMPRAILSPTCYDLRTAFVSTAARALWTVWFRDRIEPGLMPVLYRRLNAGDGPWAEVTTEDPGVLAILEGDEDWLQADIVKEAMLVEGMSEEACWETMDRIETWDGWTPLTLRAEERTEAV